MESKIVNPLGMMQGCCNKHHHSGVELLLPQPQPLRSCSSPTPGTLFGLHIHKEYTNLRLVFFGFNTVYISVLCLHIEPQ